MLVARVAFILHALASCAAVCAQESTRLVSISETYSTSYQPGLVSLSSIALANPDNPRKDLIHRLIRKPIDDRNSGDQSIFLVRAVDAADALRAVGLVLGGSRSTDSPVSFRRHRREEEPTHWLFVHLGVGSSTPARWVIDPIEIKNSIVRFTYCKSKPSMQTCDCHRYQFLAPLGRLAPGRYELQLYDNDLGLEVLTKRLDVRY